jgi:hypothetical protein
MLAILAAGYNLALSPWWLTAHPTGADRRLLRRETDKRNFKRQLAALHRWGNLFKANGVALPTDISAAALEPGIIEELNRRQWRGSFVHRPLTAAFEAVEETYKRTREQLKRTPADIIREALTREAGKRRERPEKSPPQKK